MATTTTSRRSGGSNKENVSGNSAKKVTQSPAVSVASVSLAGTGKDEDEEEFGGPQLLSKLEV